ncbi:MAG: RNA polymerase factor sigma-54 [Pseudomonadales bacterium]|nr:RNA polymerase factor sigma-54 [Pseudomonadales bacterium]
MKLSLQLRNSQSLTMTPQLQQAIKLLQLSTLDLQQEIQEALDSNPMLEVSEDETNDSENTASNEREQNEREQAEKPSLDNEHNTEETQSAENTPVEMEKNNDIPDDLPVDTGWDDIYQNGSGSSSSSGSNDNENMLETRNAAGETLYDQLVWQLELTPFSDVDKTIAFSIIEAIDENGYLTATPEEICETVQSDDEDYDLELDEVIAVLHRIHQFEPPGVGAQNLQECLLIQLRQLPEDTCWREEALLVISEHIELLGNRDFNQLIRRSKLSEESLIEVLGLIKTLSPQPGQAISISHAEYVVPDVIVTQKNGRWRVELNPAIAPRLRINNNYASMVRRADNSADNNFLRDNLQEARWFIKSLQSRNETLLKVATRIVEYQQGFFEYGEEAMKPLVLHEIAEHVEMHESTISRVTSNKYMHTPRGLFELKYFFSSHVSTESGGECSSTAIRAIIKKLIAAENPKKPLSDSKITEILKEQQIKVARRTIAKYREALSIPPSNERKRLI